MMTDSRKLRLLIFTWSLPFVVPLLAVWVGDWFFWSLTDRAFVYSQTHGVRFSQTVIASIPFLVLALVAAVQINRSDYATIRPRILGAAITGLTISFLLWGWHYLDGYLYWRLKRGGGVNFGVVFIMMLSPIWVGLGMAVGFFTGRRFFSGGRSAT